MENNELAELELEVAIIRLKRAAATDPTGPAGSIGDSIEHLERILERYRSSQNQKQFWEQQKNFWTVVSHEVTSDGVIDLELSKHGTCQDALDHARSLKLQNLLIADPTGKFWMTVSSELEN